MNKFRSWLGVCSAVFIILVSAAAVWSVDEKQEKSREAQSPVFSQSEFVSHLKFLSSDLLEGRAVGTRGGELAAAYIAAQFEAFGLQPISEEEGYFQQVPLVGITTMQDTVTFSLSAGDTLFEFKPVEEVVVNGERHEEKVSHESELLFVGYGIEAPEFNWDDYKGVDVAGKTLVMLVNDPDLEKTGFGSESLSYYGRYTYKEEIARAKGAAGLILLHTDETATYGFEVIQSSWTTEQITFEGEPKNPLVAKAWLSQPAIDKALAAVNLSYDKLKTMADSREFKPMPLGLTMKISFEQKLREMTSPNVIGILPGTSKKDEAVLYTAHYDHLGIGIPDESGDNIYNGAMDNASGTAAVICLARAYSQSPPPERSVLFIAVTGEESGLLGSSYYAEHPIFPLEKTAVAINKDVVNLLGETTAFSAFPVQYSDAIDAAREIGRGMDLDMRVLEVDRGGFSFRSDHFPFAARGVVAMSVGLAGDYRNLTKEEVTEIRRKIGRTYHSPSDEVSPLWRYDGALQELKLLYRLGRHWADGAPIPHMKPDNPFIATMRLFKKNSGMQ